MVPGNKQYPGSSASKMLSFASISPVLPSSVLPNPPRGCSYLCCLESHRHVVRISCLIFDRPSLPNPRSFYHEQDVKDRGSCALRHSPYAQQQSFSICCSLGHEDSSALAPVSRQRLWGLTDAATASVFKLSDMCARKHIAIRFHRI